jgi:hypothetical protein
MCCQCVANVLLMCLRWCQSVLWIRARDEGLACCCLRRGRYLRVWLDQVFICVYVYAYMYIRMCICVYVYVLCICVYEYVLCIYVYVYMYMYMCVYI